jgi:hypothetical protein
MRTITIGALNIVMPAPHNPQRYIDLFQRAYKRKHPVRLRGDFAGMIGSCRAEEVGGNTIVTGELYKFFDLQLDGQWYNTLEQKAAEEAELAQIHIPENLKPHFQIFPFVFFPNKHRLFFITKDQHDSFSPGQTQKLFSSVFEDLRLVREYGEIEVTVEPSTETLERIFSMPRLKRITIEVTPPNADDHDDAEVRLFEKMGLLNADRQVMELSSKKHNGLTLTDDIKTLADIGSSNGVVSGRGEDDEGHTVNVSTAEHPLQEKVEFESLIQSRTEALLTKAQELLLRITRNRVGVR